MYVLQDPLQLRSRVIQLAGELFERISLEGIRMDQMLRKVWRYWSAIHTYISTVHVTTSVGSAGGGQEQRVTEFTTVRSYCVGMCAYVCL